MAVNRQEVREWAADGFVLLSHVALGLIVALAFESVAHLSVAIRILLAGSWTVFAGLIYWWLKRTNRRAREERHRSELKLKDTEIAKWRRYQHLERGILGILTEFLKDRYRTNHQFSTSLRTELNAGVITLDHLIELIEAADTERRTQVKTALTNLSSVFVEDSHLKPAEADRAVQDCFKVSFYAVEEHNGAPCLVPKWRYYPNEGEPRTRSFKQDDGAAGLAWRTKRIVVCERGGRDPFFKDMWDGGGQKERYASMVCMPAIKDIPSEKVSDVYGILTVDSPIRDSYFGKAQQQFWADLLQPICNLLVYCQEVERRKDAIIAVARSFDSRASGTDKLSAVAPD
jgi:hypothetical protein